MENVTRKASEVILELESKIDCLLGMVRSQDLTMKILSNKLNIVLEKLEKSPSVPPKIFVETANAAPLMNNQFMDYEKQIPISSEGKLPEENSPSGFRRTSRPETFSGDDARLKKSNKTELIAQFPVQIPNQLNKKINNEVVVPTIKEIVQQPKTVVKPNVSQNAVPTIQRVVDKNGKSVFLADIEIIDKSTMETVLKTRTNGTGKWMASLVVGSYKIILNKRQSLTKEKLEVIQEIQVDGLTSPLELQTMIIK